MHNREDKINSIIRHLSILKEEVELRSKVNLQDINVHAEQFYKILLNDIFGYKLENINIVEQNAAVIDLGDKINRIAIQVTSNNSKNKINETVQAFIDKELYNKYYRLIILLIKTKTNRSDIITFKDFSFDMNKDVIDVPHLIRNIQNINDLDHLGKINDWLWKELVKKHYDARKKSKANEVTTFIRMIDLLSDEKNHKVFELESEPDPEYKIETRFKNHSSFLKSFYVDLYTDYGYALNQAETSSDITTVKIRKVGLYLKDVSNKFLVNSKNDPNSALDKLCSYFSDFFNKDGVQYDEMAIKFYLVDQLIKCNVFPN